MEAILFDCTQGTELASKIHQRLNVEAGKFETRKFPDGESYLNILSDVNKKRVIVVASLLSPDDKILQLIFLARTLRELGALNVGIVAPYLGYMRQDKKFKPGEALTSKIFAGLINEYFDWLITVDPHLHRYQNLNEIYSIPTQTLHARNLLASWVKANKPDALLVGPDEESEQWVGAVAERAGVNFCVATKQRFGDTNVQITFPDLPADQSVAVIVVDDIISSGYTMLESVRALKLLNRTDITCLAVHGIFAAMVDRKLQKAGVSQIVTTNSIAHESNAIDLSELIVPAIIEMIGGKK